MAALEVVKVIGFGVCYEIEANGIFLTDVKKRESRVTSSGLTGRLEYLLPEMGKTISQ